MPKYIKIGEILLQNLYNKVFNKVYSYYIVCSTYADMYE